jgi:uncharacterized RDD family membrane protein YckC
MERGSFPPDRPDPERPQRPEAPPGPQAPPSPQAPPGPESTPGYGGPVPPGGWQQPIARPASGWVGQPLASWGSRVGAQLIDWLVLLIPAVILFVVIVGGAVGLGDENGESWGAIVGAVILWGLVMGVVGLLYAPLLMQRDGARNGQTWGKQLMGIRVVRDSGEPLGFGWSALREIVVKGLLVGIASSIIPLVPWLLDILWPLWDDQNRALHDMVVSTHVIGA